MRAAAASSFLLILIGCRSALDACTLELGMSVRPADTTIAVGATYNATASLSSCGGRQTLTDVFFWRSDDPSVATVDSTTGRVTAQARGSAKISARGQHYGALNYSWSTVHVP